MTKERIIRNKKFGDYIIYDSVSAIVVPAIL
jgi:hypothetical protein